MQKSVFIILAFFLAYIFFLMRSHQVFDTPEKAARSLVDAIETGIPSRVENVLGEDAHDIVFSGDPVYDKNIQKAFAAAYAQEHGFTYLAEDKVIFSLGQDKWPFALPIVKRGGKWYFDVEAGKEELLFRRIGFNELSVIQVCAAYMDAQREYAEMSRKHTGIPAYAQYIISNDGKKDGLYWAAGQGEEESPLGRFMARASAEGYRGKESKTPYHGYYYKILTRQGTDAKGGQFDYVANGHMIGGFALVAWPAKYRNSGVMTFIVSHDGAIYQKDLGKETPQVVANMQEFNPDKSWDQVTLIETYGAMIGP